MRFLSSKYSACPDHPDAFPEGSRNGDISCGTCGELIGRWNLPWAPRWVVASEDAMGRSIARWLPRSVVKWTLVRATAYATEGRWKAVSALLPPPITACEVSRRWEIA